MISLIHRLPSLGFAFLTASWLLLVAFLGWGMSEPDLDQVWRVIQRAERKDFTGLSESEVEALERSVERYPRLSRALVGRDGVGLVEPTQGGWTTLSRVHFLVDQRPPVPTRIWAECRAHPSSYPVTLSFEADGLHQELKFTKDGGQSFDLKAEQLGGPLLARVTVTASGPTGPNAHPFQVRLRGKALTDEAPAP